MKFKYAISIIYFLSIHVFSNDFYFSGIKHNYSIVKNSENEPSYSVYLDNKNIIDYTQTNNIGFGALNEKVFFVREVINSHHSIYYFFDADDLELIKQVMISRSVSSSEKNDIFIDNNKHKKITVNNEINKGAAIFYFYEDHNMDFNKRFLSDLYVSSLQSNYVSLIDYYGRKIGYNQCGKEILIYGCNINKKKVMLCSDHEKYKYIVAGNGIEMQLESNSYNDGKYQFKNGTYIYEVKFSVLGTYVEVHNKNKIIYNKKCLLPSQ